VPTSKGKREGRGKEGEKKRKEGQGKRFAGPMSNCFLCAC